MQDVMVYSALLGITTEDDDAESAMPREQDEQLVFVFSGDANRESHEEQQAGSESHIEQQS